MTARIPTQSEREAMDWSLVLVSQGIESTIEHEGDSGWALLVPDSDHDRALSMLRQYRLENRHWPWRHTVFKKQLLFDWISLLWVMLTAVFFWLSSRNPMLREAGRMDSAAVANGEWWRLFTAIFLHADPAHLAMNLSLGLVLLGLAMGRYGTGVGLLAAYLAGVGGNVATWLLFNQHLSVGASGMVMGCVGLLAAQLISFKRSNPIEFRYGLTALIGGALIFVLIGLSPGTDVLAHLGGFVTGVFLGAGLALTSSFVHRGTVNVVAGLLLGALTVLSWWFAIQT